MSSTAGLSVRFTLEPKRRSDGQWENVEYIRIISVTDKFNSPHRPVEPADRVRFAKHYEAWKKGISESPKRGQPLKMWPGITPAEVNVLAQAGIHTVEELAQADEAQVGTDGPYLALRDAARGYLDLSKSTNALNQLEMRAAEKDAENAMLRERISELRMRVEEQETQLLMRVEEQETQPTGAEAPAKRGPGRPRKSEAGTE